MLYYNIRFKSLSKLVNKEGKIVLKDENKQITINGTTYNLNLFFFRRTK